MAPLQMKKWTGFVLGFLVIALITTLTTSAHLYWRNFHRPAGLFDLSQIEEMERASVVTDRTGKKLGEFYIQNRVPVPLKKIPKNLIGAVVATEDQRFWSHSGVDFWGILRAVGKNTMSGKIEQGASTLTQQLARNTFDLRGRNYKRKLLEIALAIRIEQNLSKHEILEAYLNRVYFGSGFYGVEAASQGYFGVHVSDLTLAQSATLASLLKSPNQLSPKKNPEGAKKARDVVLEQMHRLGLIDKEEQLEASEEQMVLSPNKRENKGSHFLEMVRQKAVDLLGYEKTMRGGLKIQTTLDASLQGKLEETASQNLGRLEYLHRSSLKETHEDYSTAEKKSHPPQYLQIATVVLENSTGGVLALVGGRDFSHSEYNRATQMRRPPALAYSPITILAALRGEIFAGSVFADRPLDNKFVGIGGAVGILGEWGVERPENTYEGKLTIRRAFAKGKNSAMARLSFSIGPEQIAETASLLGIPRPSPFPPSSIGLGSHPVSPLQLALAYTCFPRGGTMPESSYFVERILDPDGHPLFVHEMRDKSVFPPSMVFQVHSMLEEGMSYGPASQTAERDLTNNYAVGRSGTSYDFQDLWFAGYDSEVTSVVWVGLDKPSRIFYGAFGSKIASPIWAVAMNWSGETRSPRKIQPPIGLVKVEVCISSGELAAPSCTSPEGTPNLVEEYDRVDAPKRRVCHVHSGALHPLSRDNAVSPWPRATQTVDLSKIRPVGVRSWGVEGPDPYDSSFYLPQGSYPSTPAIPVEIPSAPSQEKKLLKKESTGAKMD